MADAGNEMDQLLDEFVASLVRDVEALPEAPAPFGEVPLRPEEQVERYLQVRGDVRHWHGVLQERGLDETIRYALAMERLAQRYGGTGDAGTDGDADAGV